MFTWISDTRGLRQRLALFGLVLLAGCAGFDGVGLLSGPPRQLVVAGGAITVAGPAGYCIERTSVRKTAAGDFVLLGSCASIAGRADAPAPTTPAVLTASISGAGVADVKSSFARLPAYFASARGRAALARDGKPGSVSINRTLTSDGAFILKATDPGRGRARGLAPDYWRAIFDLRGRIVTLSVIEFEDKPMSDKTALALLRSFVRRMRQENPTLAPAPA